MTQWRTWLFQRSRDMVFLWKASACIVGGAIALAALMQALRPPLTDEDKVSALMVQLDDMGFGVTDRYRHLNSIGKPEPEDLAEWIRVLADTMKKKPAPWVFDGVSMKLGDMEMRPLLERHLPDPEQRELFSQFIRCCLFAPGAERDEAGKHVHETAQKTPRLRFANEFEGDLLMRDNKRAEGLAAYLRETGFVDAARARNLAFTTALALKDKKALRALFADERCVRETETILLYRGAKQLREPWLIVRYFGELQWEHLTHSLTVPLAVFSAAIWYLILVHSASRERLRWWRYLSPVFAGILSVWLLEWGQSTLRYSMPDDLNGEPMQVLFQYILHVGIPEEAVKLCLFALFVPLLLRHGSHTKAALTAGCVGLGFAMDENILYYDQYGAGAAVGRLVMANFMHVALTGIAGLWFYELIRSRFNKATEFLTAFAGVAAAHGAYDFAQGQWGSKWGIDFASIVILALLARTYLHYLRPPVIAGPRPAIGSTAIFVLGLASVVAAAILISVWQTGDMKSATAVLKGTLGIIPVCVLFVREFKEV